jgi:hypothetical protein
VPASAIANPLPQALVLTAIVISFSFFAFLLVLGFRSLPGTRHRRQRRNACGRARNEPAPPLATEETSGNGRKTVGLEDLSAIVMEPLAAADWLIPATARVLPSVFGSLLPDAAQAHRPAAAHVAIPALVAHAVR